MSRRSITLETIVTTDPDRYIETEVWWNDGSLNRNARGYTMSARVYRDEGNGLRSTEMFKGSSSALIDSEAKRFSERRLRELTGFQGGELYKRLLDTVCERAGLTITDRQFA